jgi:hypothetical protein
LRIFNKRLDVARKLVNGEDVNKELIEIEKYEAMLGEDPGDIMYSEKEERIVSYREKVLEIEAQKDDFLFSLAGNKGETIDSLQKKTYAEILSFAERVKEDGRH